MAGKQISYLCPFESKYALLHQIVLEDALKIMH